MLLLKGCDFFFVNMFMFVCAELKSKKAGREGGGGGGWRKIKNDVLPFLVGAPRGATEQSWVSISVFVQNCVNNLKKLQFKISFLTLLSLTYYSKAFKVTFILGSHPILIHDIPMYDSRRSKVHRILSYIGYVFIEVCVVQ
jgi:hypothetical protein